MKEERPLMWKMERNPKGDICIHLYGEQDFILYAYDYHLYREHPNKGRFPDFAITKDMVEGEDFS